MVVVLLTLSAIFERGSESTEEQWGHEITEAFTYYIDEHLIPVNSALAAERSCNQESYLADVIKACERFIQVLTERKDELTRAADRFESLAGSAPNETPAEGKQVLYETSRVLRSMHEADMLLVAGWSERDEQQWETGWGRKDEARQVLRILSEELHAGDAP